MNTNLESAELEVRLRQINETTLEREDIEDVLAAYAKRNGLPPMMFDDNGLIDLTIKDELPLALMHIPPFPGVMASVGLPEGLAARDDILRDLLRANRSWAATGGATFAKLPDGGDYVLCRLISLADRDDEAFERAFLAFAEFALEHVRSIELAFDLPFEGAGEPAAGEAAAEMRSPTNEADGDNSDDWKDDVPPGETPEDAAASRPRPSDFA